jgi:acyl transferase domain-containing protein
MYRGAPGRLCLSMTVAFLYPAEGAQHPGMAAALHATDRALLDRHLRLAADVTGLPVRRLCLEGTAEQLARPDVGQPALFALLLALTEVARDEGIEPGVVAGRGLGEIAAAVVAGALAPADGMRLVALRSRVLGQGDAPGACAALRRRAAAMTWRPAELPLAAGAFGGLVRDPGAIRAALAEPAAATGWTACLRALEAAGATASLELGPRAAGSREAIAAFAVAA